MNLSQATFLIETDSDFIYNKRYNYSSAELMEKYPEGAPDKIIASCLLMTEEELEECYQTIVVKLRKAMKVEL